VRATRSAVLLMIRRSNLVRPCVPMTIQVHVVFPRVADDLPEGRPRNRHGLGPGQEAKPAAHPALQRLFRLADHLLPQLLHRGVGDMRAGDAQGIVDDMQHREVGPEPLGQFPRIRHGLVGVRGEIHRAEGVADGGGGATTWIRWTSAPNSCAKVRA